MQGAAAEGGDNSGDGEDQPDRTLGPLDEADDGRKFADLDAAEQGRTVAHARVAGDGGDIVGIEMAGQPVQRVGIKAGIAVDTDEDFCLRQQRRGVEADRLALVFQLVYDAQLGKAGSQRIEQFAGAVAAAVVDGDDFEIRVCEFHQCFYGFLDMRFLVVAGDEDSDQRVVVARRRLVDDTVRLPLETQIKRQTADHPDEGHQHRVEEDVGEDGTPGIAKQDG